MKQARILSITVLSVFLSLAAAAGVFVSSTVSRSEVKVGESFTFTLRFEGLPSPVPQPMLPQIEGAAVKGQYQSAETGKNGQAYLYHYIISPSKSGRIGLADFSARVENQSIRVPGFSVTVGENPVPALRVPEEQSRPAGDDIFFEGRIEKDNAYVGEAIVYSLHLMTRESIRNFEFVQKSEFDGFRKIEIPSSRFPPTAKVTRNGKIYLDATILKCVLYPLRSGPVSISPFQADIKVQARGGSSNPVIRLKGGGSSLRVKDLPDAPVEFRGAIGTFNVAYSGAAPGGARVGEPLTIDIRVRGEGSLPADPFPASKSPFFTSYPVTYEDRAAEPEGPTAVDRVYRLSWVPAVAGRRDLPDMNFFFFDTSSGQFRKSSLPPLSVSVSEGAGTPGKLQQEILPLLPVGNPEARRKAVSAGTAAWILIIPFFFALAVFGASELAERFFLSPEKKKLRLLTSRAVKEYRNARSHLDARKSKLFHNHLKKSLEAVIEIKTGQPAAAFTIVELRSRLLEKGVGEREADMLTGFAEEIDAAAFSNEQPPKTELMKKLEKMREIISKRRKKGAVLPVLLFFSVLCFAQGQGSLLTSKAADEYGKRNFEEALRYYRIVEESGAANPALFYNMGNCCFESGKIPGAILYYKKALRLDPALKPARDALATARSLIPAKASPYEPSPFESLLMNISTDIFFCFAAALLSLACLAFCWLRVFNISLARTVIFRAAVVLLVSGLAAASMFFMAVRLRENMREGIVLEAAPVYQKPDPSLKPVATLPEGSEIYVVRNSGRWSMAKWGEGEGWTYSEKIGIP